MKNQINAKFLIIAMAIAVVFTMAFNTKAQSDKLPAPDFSEFEKWYEVVRWTYEDNGTIKMVVKAKTAPPQTHRLFVFRYLDEDGINVIDTSYTQIGIFGYNNPVGQPERVEGGAPNESQLKKVKSFAIYRILDDGTLVGPKPPEPSKNNSTSTKSADAKKQEQAETKSDVDDDNQPGDCNYDTQPALGSAGKFSEALVKSALYERYSFETDTGGLSSPLAVGETFLNIKLLGSYANTVTVIPGRGAQRKHDGAPVGATIYRFHAQYIVCRKYKNAVRRTQYESDNVCFKAGNGNWDCPVDSVPQITELK